jgi:hypothetical protein
MVAAVALVLSHLTTRAAIATTFLCHALKDLWGIAPSAIGDVMERAVITGTCDCFGTT